MQSIRCTEEQIHLKLPTKFYIIEIITLACYFFSQKVSFQWNPAEKICMPRGENIFHLYRRWNWICFTHNLLYIAAVINFKGSRIHFSNETMTILLLKSLNMSPKKTLHSTFSTIILRIWFSWYGNQRNFTLPKINTAFLFKDWVVFGFSRDCIIRDIGSVRKSVRQNKKFKCKGRGTKISRAEHFVQR